MQGMLGSIVSRAVAATIVCAALVSAGQNLSPPGHEAAAASKPARITDVSYNLASRPGRVASVKLTVEGAPRSLSVRLTPTGRWLTCTGKNSHWTCPAAGMPLSGVTKVSARFSD